MRRLAPARRRPLALLSALAVLVTALALAVGTDPRPAAADSPTGGTPVTASGHDAFSKLKVTVSQTQHLVNQVVKVSWKGGDPTDSDTTYASNYLQIMQCWGDAASGPDPDQCQFGGSSALGAGTGSQAAGSYTNTRQLTYAGLTDPAQKMPPPTPSGISYVPFHSVTGDIITKGNWNEFYDVSTSNEVPYARTGSNGTGQVYFEVQTALEAPGLGCGEVPTGRNGAPGRSCWLVVVPRGTTEVDGDSYLNQPNGLLRSSPLSATNWKQRIVVPLRFEPIGNYCPIGADERSTLGDEIVAEAVLRWQPALCQTGKKTIYGYAEVTDDTARAKLASKTPGMVFLNRPPTPDQLPPDRKPVYAPVTLSGLTFGFFVESQAGFGAPPAVKARNGTRLTSLNLTPRLVAKLLTESYQDGNSRFAPGTAKNPFNLARDPEFRKYNPDYADLDFGGALGDAIVPEALSDSAWRLWDWIDKDPAAREFLNGVADNAGRYGDHSFSGMTVNPSYKGIKLPVSDYPKSDPFCQQFADHPDNPLCVQDKHPYASDMHTGARAVARGDTLARTTWDNTTIPPAYKKNPPQTAGQRAVLAVTDTATASRYGLVTAKLQNASGHFVAPTTASLLAGQAAMKPGGVGGTLNTDPRALGAGVYPLTLLTYAATVPEQLGKAEGQDFATLLRYVAGTGQQPGVAAGTLPDGYAPLPANLRQQTRDVATAIANRAGAPASSGSGTSGGSTSGGGSSGGSGSSGGGSGSSGGGNGGTGTAGGPSSQSATPTPSASPTGKPSSAPAGQTPVAANRPLPLTPAWALGALRYVLLIVLVTGLVAAAGGPLLPRVAPRLSLALRARFDRGTPTPPDDGKG
ncbi:hypothetical protein AB0M29_04100 [Streptomyces sp. NPDC051976]|uniref:hypothetical protein n=1 Tax=Streptomyces sp. NPDC051976 TaxID=3154947 RepID=UPI00341B5AE1